MEDYEHRNEYSIDCNSKLNSKEEEQTERIDMSMRMNSHMTTLLLDMQQDVQIHCLSFLDLLDLKALSMSCHSFHHLLSTSCLCTSLKAEHSASLEFQQEEDQATAMEVQNVI